MPTAINPNDVTWDSGPPPQAAKSGINPDDVTWDGPAVSPPKGGFSPDEQKQFLAFIPKAKKAADLDAYARTLTNGRVGISNADEIFKDQQQTKRKLYGFSTNPDAADTAPEPDLSFGDYAKSALVHAGHGLVSGLAFIDDAINPFEHLPRNPFRTPTKAELEADAGPGFFQRNVDAAYTAAHPDVAEPAKTTGQRYLNNVAEFGGGAAIPMGEFNGIRGIAGLASAAVGGGVANQAAKDAFPDNPVVQDLAGLVGAHVGGTPFALKPIRDNVYVSKAAEHPEAAYVPPAVQGLAAKAADVAPNGLTPKGRGKLTVQQINAVAKENLVGMPDDLNRLVAAGKLDPAEADTLKKAIQRKDGITAPEIDALRGTPEGDATAEALMHYRAVSNLTKPFGGDGRGIPSKAWNALVKVTPIPKLIADAITIKPGDVNASRIRGADKAIDRLPVYQKLADKVGPSPTGPAMGTFRQRVADTFEADKDAQAQSAADASAKADAKAARYGMTDSQFANYSARSSSADAALKTEPVPAPRKATVQSALNKYQKAADTGSQKLSDFDTKLNAPPEAPKPVKRSPMDNYVSTNIENGVHGNYNAYADTLGVKRDDVLRALGTIKTDDIDPFEIQKLVHGYKLSPAGRAGLIPRLQKALTDDGTVAARAKEAQAPPAPAATAQPKAAASPKAPRPTKAAEPGAAPDDSGNYREIMRPVPHAEGKSRYQYAFDTARAKTASIPDFKDMEAVAGEGLDHIKTGEKTTESAMRYFDKFVGPKLREHFMPDEIDAFRQEVEHMATVGKPYQTDADLERYAKKPRR